MDDQSQSLDALIQLNQDFCVPDQLFDDSDIGVEEIYNTVEIETNNSDEYTCNSENIVKDGGNVMMTSTAAETPVYDPLPKPQDTTIKNSVNSQGSTPSNMMIHQIGPVSQSGSCLPTPVGTVSRPVIPMATQIVTQAGVLAPLVTPSSVAQTPLRMVTVPVNSDVITQGNSQVVLIPMGGMDSSRLESTLKVPLGQKLVIIKPQEILKTIEEKKSQKVQSPTMVGITAEQARSLAVTQHGIVMQGTNQGRFQQIPMSPVGKLTMVAGSPAKKGLVKVLPKGVVPVPVSQSAQRTHHGNSLGQVVMTSVPTAQQNVQRNVTNKTAIPRQTAQFSASNSNSNIQPQITPSQISKPPGHAGKTSTAQQVVTGQEPRTTTQSKAVCGVDASQQKLPTSATNNSGTPQATSKTLGPVASSTIQVVSNQIQKTSNQVGNIAQANTTTSQTSLTSSQASLTTSQTSLTSSQASLTAAQQQHTPVGVKKALSTESKDFPSGKPNLYQTLKQKLTQSSEGTLVSNETITADFKQNKTVAQGVKTAASAQSTTQPSQMQKSSPNAKASGQKIVVTYVSPTGKAAQKLDTSKTSASSGSRTGGVIQVPAKLEGNGLKRNTLEQSGKVLSASNSSLPVSQPASGQLPKMVPTISPQIRHIKTEGSKNDSSQPSTSAVSVTNELLTVLEPKWPSIEQHEKTLNSMVRKRGRPRKHVPEQTANMGQTVRKTVSGPTLQHELERTASSGRLKTVKPSEHQMKAVKHKRVSNTNPWTCALCGKVSFANSLGCLYGPYDENSDVARERGDGGGGPEPKRRRGSSHSDDGSPRKSRSESGDELWFHGECVVWSPGVYVLGESLAGYKQVVYDAQSRKCNYCGDNGATLVCLQRACKKQYHFFCAKKNGCVFEESNYTIQCGKHIK